MQDCVAGLPGPFISTGACPSFLAASTPLALGCQSPPLANIPPRLPLDDHGLPHLQLLYSRSSLFWKEPRLLLLICRIPGGSLPPGPCGCGSDKLQLPPSHCIPPSPRTHIPQPLGEHEALCPGDRRWGTLGCPWFILELLRSPMPPPPPHAGTGV